MSDSATGAVVAERKERRDRAALGFWIYLMTDCVIFASLFAVYAVLHNNTFGGPSGKELFDLPYILTETLLLLTSSFACGLAMLAIQNRAKDQAIFWLTVTGVLGLAFLGMEMSEFRHLVVGGNSWRRSGFLSSYFTLVGTHGLHIAFGLLWLGVMLWRTVRNGLGAHTVRRLTLFSLFWHFLDVVWIFIFSIVYLMGAISV